MIKDTKAISDILGATRPTLRECKLCGLALKYTMICSCPTWGPSLCDKCGEKVHKHEKEQLQESIKNNMIERSGIPMEYMLWDNKKAEELGTMHVINWMKANREGSFYIHGGNGHGKTHTVAAAAYVVLKDNLRGVFYMPVSKWLGEIMEAKMMHKDFATDIVKVSTVDLLVMDDLGKEKLSESKLELIYNIIDTRERQGKQTWITSNFDIDELSKRLDSNYGPAIVERIRRMAGSGIHKM